MDRKAKAEPPPTPSVPPHDLRETTPSLETKPLETRHEQNDRLLISPVLCFHLPKSVLPGFQVPS
jgi:hypothetical protein